MEAGQTLDQSSAIGDEDICKKICDKLSGEKKKKRVIQTTDCSIYRVPNWIRQQNEKAYEPQMVSIGPLHHGKPGLRFMEAYKKMYLEDFLSRTDVSLKNLVNFVLQTEEKVRKCYAEDISETSRCDLVEMVLVDSVFVIEVLLKYSLTELRTEDDWIFNREGILRNIWADFWLLENQLPLFILEDIFRISKVYFPLGDSHYIIKLALRFLNLGMEVKDVRVEKFYQRESEIVHLLDLLRICLYPDDLEPKKWKLVKTAIPRATELKFTGVSFKTGMSGLSLRFDNGIFSIPRLTLSFKTEIILRNLLIFETYHCNENYINDYLIVMDRLIDDAADVDLLVDKGIIDIWVGDSSEAAALFNNIGKIVTVYPTSFFYGDLCRKVNKYHKNRWRRIKAMLRVIVHHQYLNTPWAIISIIAGFILLGLTITQTVFGKIKD